MAQAINQKLATKVLDIVDQGLCSGVGEQKPGKMCVEAAVCFAMGEPHSDQPTCVFYSVRDCKIELNDNLPWKSNSERAEGLRKISVLQLGSNAMKDRGNFQREYRLRAWKNLLPFIFPHKKPAERAAIVLLSKSMSNEELIDLLKAMEVPNISRYDDELNDPLENFQHDFKIKKHHRKAVIKALVKAAEDILIEGKCKGAKLWAKLPPKIRNKKILKSW